MISALGWCATVVFVASYFTRRPETLRRVQTAGALLWVCYGYLVHAPPVIAANLLILVAAGWTTVRAALSATGSPTHRS